MVGYGFLNFQIKAQTNLDIRVRQLSPQADVPDFAPNQLIVKFKRGASGSAIEVLKADHGAAQIRKSKSGSFVTLGLPEGSDVLDKAGIFSKNPLVEYAHPNYFAQAHFVPNDTFYCFQWHLDDSLEGTSTDLSCHPLVGGNPFGGMNGGGIGLEDAWDIDTGSASIVVAVIDTGVAYQDFSDSNPANCYDIFGILKKCSGAPIDTYVQAPDLANTNFLILPGSDFVNSDDHPNDDEAHGTHVSGTVAQSTDNSLGVAGVAFNTTIMPIKVLDANGSGLLDAIADGIEFAADSGADVINLSLGSEFDAPVMKAAVAHAFDSGVTVVTSAGNDFTTGNDTQYPAAYDAYVIAVGATQYDETHAPYSSTGSYVDVTAPGGNNSVDQNGDGFADGVLQQTFSVGNPSAFSYFFYQGTSMASPHVAGLAALILSVDNSLTPTQVRNVIESTAEDKGDAGRDDVFGHGIIDANAALLSLAGPAVSIVLNTDGTTPFGIRALGETIDTTASGTNDVQVIEVTTGPADLKVRSTNFSDGANTWSLAATNGADQVKWEFSKDGTSWSTFTSANTLFAFDTNVAQSTTRNLSLRLTIPTTTSSGNEHTGTVTIVATTPSP